MMSLKQDFFRSFGRCTLTLAIFGLLFLSPLPVLGAGSLKPVTLQLRWDHQFQFAGYYAADWLGYYEAEGIDPDIRSAFSSGKVLDATEEVAAGQAQFGVGAADILIARDQGIPLKLVASFFQRSAVAYYCLDTTAASSVYDLARLNIARREHDLLDVELQALFLSEGIHPFTSIYANVPRDFTVEDLTSGRYDLVPGYLGKLPYQADLMGIPIKTVNPARYGIDFYGDTLFTSATLAASDPALVEGFRRASIRGWTYALEHPEEIADKIAAMTYSSGMSDETLKELAAFNRYQANQVAELTHYPLVEIGNINPFRWSKMAATLDELNIIAHPVPIDAMIFDYQAIRLSQLKRTGELGTAFLTVALITTTLLFIFHLNRRNFMLKQEIEVRHETELLLKTELEENRRKEALILYQARMAAMGEMIGNIAHQWRQPLNTLRLILSNLQDTQTPTVQDQEYVETAYERAHALIEKMSVTIDDFRYFSNPRSEARTFEVLSTLNTAAELMDEQLRASGITLTIAAAASPVIYGMDNQLSHALFNIITNAADALRSRHLSEDLTGQITVRVSENPDHVFIEIADNGPGISLENASRIFDIYFTTRSESGGTGLGLYMAKNIIENTFHGTLKLQPSSQGACFQLILPKQRPEVTHDQ